MQILHRSDYVQPNTFIFCVHVINNGSFELPTYKRICMMSAIKIRQGHLAQTCHCLDQCLDHFGDIVIKVVPLMNACQLSALWVLITYIILFAVFVVPCVRRSCVLDFMHLTNYYFLLQVDLQLLSSLRSYQTDRVCFDVMLQYT